MKQNFIFNRQTKIEAGPYLEYISHNTYEKQAVVQAIYRMTRDMSQTLSLDGLATENKIIIDYDHDGLLIHKAEQYCISFEHEKLMRIIATDALGVVYALFKISEIYLEIPPFWYWLDMPYKLKESCLIPIEHDKHRLNPTQHQVKYRGWFINDEILIDHWSEDGHIETTWEMAFEALLRLGGNVVIPGTDKNSKLYTDLAASMGLWLTHHHAEPMGAEMFSRAYPDKEASFDLHGDLFIQLWDEAIERQKDMRIIWNLGFRGQGDCPFWASDPKYATDEERGAVISKIIMIQYERLLAYSANPICCVNLYGEVMELYSQGHLKLPPNIIRVWADNGYGKMVTRRQGNHNPRIEALPPESELELTVDNAIKIANGMYYHVSFYDLQAANHMTMLPNSLEFVRDEIKKAYQHGVDDFMIINGSNIKPHTLHLAHLASLWQEEPGDFLSKYVNTYYTIQSPQVTSKLTQAYDHYAKYTCRFGEHIDERAGEQFMNYGVRLFMDQWWRADESPSKQMLWAHTGPTLGEQMSWFGQVTKQSYEDMSNYLTDLQALSSELSEFDCCQLEQNLIVQVEVYVNCLEGTIRFVQAYENKDDLMEAFYLLGLSVQAFSKANEVLRASENQKWQGFYENECLCDIKFTAQRLKSFMAHIRMLGDGPYYNDWQRELTYDVMDRQIVLLTNTENHFSDWDLWTVMKGKRSDGADC